ncbi:hypothetical protein P43SY_009238 [Pythium insidiosum]|uniref:EF-hand domain-containing protein n=1 Tax=Pythium insidiosum TaxID=114742 RepID=A0AAD5QBS5_PYTIN|nr:hypothetical protein P43SY_009238 [Pythium insidiosum]
MRVTTWCLVAAVALLSTLGSTEVEAKRSKKIAMKGDIVPSWNDLVPKQKRRSTKKISLQSVHNYWEKLEKRDVRAYSALYKAKDEKAAAAAEVRSFYDRADACLKTQKWQKRYKKAQFTRVMTSVRECIYSSDKAPEFDVDEEAQLPPSYSDPIVADDPVTTGDDDDDDDGDDELEAPDADEPDDGEDNTPPMAPAPEPQPPQPEPVPVPEYEPRHPEVEPEPQPSPPNEIVPLVDPQWQTRPPSFIYSPRIREVPPFAALDLDGSSTVDMTEWQEYIARTRDVAIQRVEQGADPLAMDLVRSIVDFHYGVLNDCIAKKTAERTLGNDAVFLDIKRAIESECYVKFRYSLFAGPPPFEWIAKSDLTVTASQIEKWLTKRLAVAKHDLEVRAILEITPEERKQLEHIVACAFKVLRGAGESPIDRDGYYGALTQIEQCVSSYPTL